MTALAASAALLALGVLALYRIERARRRALREALHELRRPLQALMLGSRSGSRESALLVQLRVATADLEDVAEGRRPAPVRERFTVGELLRETEQRWPGAPVAIAAAPGQTRELEGDRVRLGMALDNLIGNGLEHGGSGVAVSATGGERNVRFEVINGAGAESNLGRPARRGRGSTKRGNGLRIAARHVASAQGRLERPHLEDGRIVAAVELPAERGSGPDAA